MTKVFRGLVAGSLVLFVVVIAIGIFEPELPDEVNAYLEGEGAGPVFSALESGSVSLQILGVALMVGFLVAYVASCIGLLMFRRWARATFIGVAVVGLAATPWLGASLYTPLTSTVETLFNMIDGAILVTLLFDPIKAKFADRTARA
jgi:hypothetical protein